MFGGNTHSHAVTGSGEVDFHNVGRFFLRSSTLLPQGRCCRRRSGALRRPAPGSASSATASTSIGSDAATRCSDRSCAKVRSRVPHTYIWPLVTAVMWCNVARNLWSAPSGWALHCYFFERKKKYFDMLSNEIRSFANESSVMFVVLQTSAVIIKQQRAVVVALVTWSVICGRIWAIMRADKCKAIQWNIQVFLHCSLLCIT